MPLSALYIASVLIAGTAFKSASAEPDLQKKAETVAASPKDYSSIRFPEICVGKVFSLPKGWKMVLKRYDDKYVGVAKGKVSVPNLPLSLKLDYILTSRPQLLVIPPSNIVQIYGDNIEFDDSICEPISKISSVVRVDLNGCDLTDAGVDQLCKMKQLKALIIAKTLIKGSCLRAMGDINLLYIDISHNAIEHRYYKYLAALTNLVKARLDTDDLTDESLKSVAQMKSLRDLDLRNNLKITDDGMKYLLPLKNLQVLNIRDSRIGVPGIESLLKNMKLKALTVDDKTLANAAGKRLLAMYPKVLNAYTEKDTKDVDVLYAPLK